MFDIGFLELLTIAVVALVVLGPDKLPGTIRTLGLWIGRLRRSFNNIKREIEQEIGADEIRRQLRNEAIMEKFNSTKTQISNSIESVKKEADSVKDSLDLKKEFSDITGDSKTGEHNDQKSNESGGEPDPIEALATNDPTARQSTPKAEPGSEATTDEPEGQSTEQDSASPPPGEPEENTSPAGDDNPGKTESSQ